MKRPAVTVALMLVLIGACGNGSTAGAARSERERDSILGQSTFPGARGVQGALDMSDTARARRAAEDSAAAAP